MCGRYVLYQSDKLAERYETENTLSLPPLYNIAPGMDLPVITKNSPNKIVLMRWGLIPFWADDPKIGFRTINARAESVASKPAYKRAFAKQRCLVPANGFYEWKNVRGNKLPYYFYSEKQSLMSFAGLYDIWKDKNGKEISSFTIITTEANDDVIPVHTRMPCVLPLEHESEWLDKTFPQDKLLPLLRSCSRSSLTSYSVSTEVNSPGTDSENLIKPINSM